MNRFAYRDREGHIHIVIAEIPLPGNLWICRRDPDGKTLYLHASHLQPITD